MRERHARMLDLAVEVMGAEDPEHVWHLLAEELLTALDAELVVLKEEPWTRERGAVVLRSPPARPGHHDDESVRRRIREGYPFAGHYGPGGDMTPQSAARITGARAWRHSATADALHRAFGTRHMLGIPFPGAGPYVSGFVVHRPGRDFSPYDLRYATRVQPLLRAATNHRSLLKALREKASDGDRRRRANRALEAPLTPRELNVLHLLATGLPADAMARRLGISPRTVHKHLHALYRKLGVADRLGAVLRAQDAGLLAAPDDAVAPPGSGAPPTAKE